MFVGLGEIMVGVQSGGLKAVTAVYILLVQIEMLTGAYAWHGQSASEIQLWTSQPSRQLAD